jgi:hypothetical protein
MPVNVRQPHINMSKLAAFISEKKILSRAGITSGKEFIDELKILNDFYAKTSNEKYKEWGIGDIEKIKTLINKKNHDKCLYLGIYNCLEWLTFMADHLAFNKPYEDMNHISSTAKVVVTTDLRKKVWGIDSMRGICYVCSANIEYTGFECGHIIPRSLGGSTTLDNLKPICRGCNSDMGIMNLEDYRKMHILQNKIS